MSATIAQLQQREAVRRETFTADCSSIKYPGGTRSTITFQLVANANGLLLRHDA